MNLIIYTCCQTEDAMFGYEMDWRMEWSIAAPQLGAVVSMGAEARWCVVKIIIYRPKGAQDVDTVYLTYLHPGDEPVPPEEEWDSAPIMDSVQSIHAEVVAVGKEELGLSPIESARVPKVGEQVESDIDPISEDGVPLGQPKFWTIQRVVTYIPVAEMKLTTPEETNYQRAFVCWCEPTEVNCGT